MSIVVKTEKKDEFNALLRVHFGSELTQAELDLFGLICERTKLDPFIKQIYPIKRKNKQKDGSYKEIMVIQVGIDGLRSIAESTGCYAPGKEPSFVYDQHKNLVSATAYVKKMTPDGTWHEVAATAFMSEYKPKFSTFWDSMPHVMLPKCSEALAIRKAFPVITAKLYTPEEMAQSEAVNLVQSEVSDIEIDSPKKMNPRAKEEPSSSKFVNELVELDKMTHPRKMPMPSIDQLKEHLAADNIPSGRLEEWIQLRCQMKKETPERIIQSCLVEDMISKFKKTFTKWLATPQSPEALAV